MSRLRPRLAPMCAALAAAWVSGCGGGGDVAAPAPPAPPTLAISSVDPTSAYRGTTLNVRVLGSGFDQGSRALWARSGDTAFAVTKTKTNSTTFVSAGELLANITIQSDARLGTLDVAVVTAAGRQVVASGQFAVNLSIETIDLGAGVYSEAKSVNNKGQIVGVKGTTVNASRAFLWDNGTITELGVLPGMTFSRALDINESGQVVGVSGTGTTDNPTSQRGFIWSLAGGMQALSTLGGTIATAQAISDNGDIVGFSTRTGSSIGHAVVWRNDVITDLQSSSFALDEARAFAVNNLGEVVGYIYGGTRSAFRWSPTAPIALLPGGGLPFGINDGGCTTRWTPGQPSSRLCGATALTLGTCGGSESRAWAINRAGQVVGDASTGSTGVTSAFFWAEADGISCLSRGQESSAAGINDNGWVVGYLGPFGGGRATLWKVK